MRVVKGLFVTVIIGFSNFSNVWAQYESSSPSIPKQEYFNPAYNACKTYGSLDVMFRQQWVDSNAETPEMFAATIYLPTKKNGLGLGGSIIAENIGLRSVNTFNVSISKGIRIDESSYLSVGLGLGYEFMSYRQSKIRAYPEVDFSQVDMNQSHQVVSLGFMALLRYCFLGASSNLQLNKYDFDFKYLTGFDAFAGRILVLNEDYVFKTIVTGKYYKQERYDISGEIAKAEFVAPVIDCTVSCLMYERVWLGLGCRFGQAVTAFVNYRVNNQFNAGAKYEVGVGSGYNKYNSQGVYLTYNFGKGKYKKNSGYRFYKGVYVRRSRLRKPINEYLY
ncbi:type IX secretion system membrane protein PorP/SprF [Labilibaculum euxinus]